jgi:hypothetical protein
MEVRSSQRMRTLVTRMAQLRPVRFSNRPLRVKRFQTIHPTVSMSLTGSCFSSESHQGRSIMGFEDEGSI